jgi:purine-binding chemotaxis protein CheW
MTRTRRTSGGSIDWITVRERLTRAQASANETEVSAERARAILAERARLLARKQADAHAAGDTIEALSFALGTERYAVETKYVREVVRLVDVTPVPGAPDFVVGVTNHRGQVLCVVDLRSFLPAPATGVTDLTRIIVLGMDTAEFGVLADVADEIRQLSTSEILPPPETVAGVGREYLRGVTKDALIVLDGALLLHDSRLVVDQRETGAA